MFRPFRYVYANQSVMIVNYSIVCIGSDEQIFRSIIDVHQAELMDIVQLAGADHIVYLCYKENLLSVAVKNTLLQCKSLKQKIRKLMGVVKRNFITDEGIDLFLDILSRNSYSSGQRTIESIRQSFALATYCSEKSGSVRKFLPLLIQCCSDLFETPCGGKSVILNSLLELLTSKGVLEERETSLMNYKERMHLLLNIFEKARFEYPEYLPEIFQLLTEINEDESMEG